MPGMEKLEEHIAHLARVVDDLSDVVARQETEIGQLKRRVALLLQREAERESDSSGAEVIGDQRPPHY